jgi:ABC-type dipeptide/oligopeptide/nickel transport system permease component
MRAARRVARFLVRSYAVRRVAIIVPQVFGITLLVFVLVRLFPGDPAYLFAGPTASPETVEAIRDDLGLNDPIYVQYWNYLVNLAQGDMGTSLVTSQPVSSDILARFPATFELITFALLICLLIGVPLGALGARNPGGPIDYVTRIYSQLAGSLPDFWWGLILILVVFVTLGIGAAPVGRLDIGEAPPQTITGLYTIDALMTADWSAFRSALSHLLLPGFTLAFVYGAPIVKQMRTGMASILDSPYLAYATICGLSSWMLFRYAFRNAMLPATTMAGLTYAYLIGAAVVVETVFSWGGLGQYAVQAITNSDYAAVSGTVLATTIYALLIYLILDFLYVAIDPRIRY